MSMPTVSDEKLGANYHPSAQCGDAEITELESPSGHLAVAQRFDCLNRGRS